MQSRERYFVFPSQSIHDIPKDVENLYFCGYGNEEEDLTVLDFSSFGFTHLRSITIGNECFENVRLFVLDGLDNLESVEIGKWCFVVSGNDSEEEEEEHDDGICRITNCPNLTQLKIGNASFGDFNQFELSNVNSLKSITFGDYCFIYADCILKGE